MSEWDSVQYVKNVNSVAAVGSYVDDLEKHCANLSSALSISETIDGMKLLDRMDQQGDGDFGLATQTPVDEFKNENKFCDDMNDINCINCDVNISDETHAYLMLSNAYSVIIIIDIGATRIMLPSKEMFTTLTARTGKVSGLDGKMSIPIEGEGKTNLFKDIAVLYVPKLKYGLISFSMLFKMGFKLIIDLQETQNDLICYDASGNVYFTATFDPNINLFKLDQQYVDILLNPVAHSSELMSEIYSTPFPDVAQNHSFNRFIKIPNSKSDVGNHRKKPLVSYRYIDPLVHLHVLMGHMSENRIKYLIKNRMIRNCPYTYDQIKDKHLPMCTACQDGRMTAFPPLPQHITKWDVGEKWCSDQKDVNVSSVHNDKWTHTNVDRASHYIVGQVSKRKDNTLELFVELVMFNENAGYKMKIHQSDYDSNYNSKDFQKFCLQKNIQPSLSTPHVKYENGFIEHTIGIVFDKTRTLMNSHAGIPKKFWCYAYKHAIYILNRSPFTDSLVTPYEKYFKLKPSMGNIVPFWAPGIFYVTKDQRTNVFAGKSEPCRFLGIDEKTNNGYQVISLISGRVLTREFCIFNEHISAEELMKAYNDTIQSDVIKQGETSNNSFDESDTILMDIDHYAMTVEMYDEIIALNSLELPYCPKNENDAYRIDCPDREIWLELWMDEINQFNEYQVLRECDKNDEPGKEMKVKFIFEVKFDNNFRVKRKVRLVACGYSQIKNINYNETYAPTPSVMVVKLLLCLSVILKLFTASFDIRGAFLEGENDYPNYIYLPGILFSDGMKRRYRVLASMYGEKQASKIFNDKLNSILVNWKFIRCHLAKTLYVFWDINGIDYIIVNMHVDDGFTASTKELLITKLYDEFDTVFIKKIERYIPILKFIGLQIEYSESNMYISQNLYVHKILDEVNCKVGKYNQVTPMPTGLNLRKAEINDENESLLEHTGKFRFLSDRTRYDIMASTGELSCGGANNPSNDHVKVAHQIYQYLSCHTNMKLKFGGDIISPFCFCDASYNSGFGRLAGCLFLNLLSGAFHCISQNDRTVSRSVCESEIKAIDAILLFIIEMIEILEFLKIKFVKPIPIYCDNEVAKELCETIKNPKRTNHIIKVIEFIRERINNGMIKLIFIPSELNVADVLTKALNEQTFNRHIDILFNGFNGNDVSTTFVTWEEVIEMYNIIETD